MTKQFVDLSHTIEHGLITYKGLPAPIICDFLSREQSKQHYAAGTEFQIGKIEMVANTGTYLDSPFHRYGEGKDLSELELTSLADLAGVVIRAKGEEQRAINAAVFDGIDVSGKAVLIHTGWDSHSLLGAGIPIVEHMCKLDQLPDKRFKFFAVPVKVKGMGTFPVRAFAIVE